MSLPREAWGCGWWFKAWAQWEPRLSRWLLSCHCVCQQRHICLTMLLWLQSTPHHLSHHCPNNLARHSFHWLNNPPWSFCPKAYIILQLSSAGACFAKLSPLHRSRAFCSESVLCALMLRRAWHTSARPPWLPVCTVEVHVAPLNPHFR